jgi:Pyruvate/2-oxoacid:ferredoxin oxidoreductase delta subunit
MPKSDLGNHQVIRIDEGITDSKRPEPRIKSLRPKRITDYPDVPAVYLEIAKRYASPLLTGPPICDELVALVQHMFTEEEASLVRHIRSPVGKTAKAVAAAAYRSIEEVRPILERLAYEKFILFSAGTGEKRRYGLMPLLPGVFELALIRTSLDTLTDWHRRLAELFAALYDTGFSLDYIEHPAMTVRYVPVGETIKAHPRALPSDRLEKVLDKYDVFAVGLCQCRMTEEIVGRGCGRPLENCIAFGDVAEFLIRHDKMRRVEKKDILEIKTEAASVGLASFITEMEWRGSISGASCSCCGCCCGALRTISEFNTPGLVAPPHFVPEADLAKCTYCGKCAKVCPAGAIVVDSAEKSHQHLAERCIGCGLCAVACDKQHAIRMEPTRKYREPPTNILAAALQMMPNYLRNARSVWKKYR